MGARILGFKRFGVGGGGGGKVRVIATLYKVTFYPPVTGDICQFFFAFVFVNWSKDHSVDVPSPHFGHFKNDMVECSKALLRGLGGPSDLSELLKVKHRHKMNNCIN